MNRAETETAFFRRAASVRSQIPSRAGISVYLSRWFGNFVHVRLYNVLCVALGGA